MDLRKALRRSLERPDLAWAYGISLTRGFYYRILWRLRGQRVIVGRRFRVRGRLDIRGPGTVIFGDDCRVASTYIAPTTPWTHSPDAIIRFGNRVGLAGTRIGCNGLIDVADSAHLADARILDTDFHDVNDTSGERHKTTGQTKPVIVGRNAWLGTGSMILKGVTIGENAVVGAGSVVVTDVPANTIVFGNPARVVRSLIREEQPPQPPQAVPSGRG